MKIIAEFDIMIFTSISSDSTIFFGFFQNQNFPNQNYFKRGGWH